MAGVDIVAAVDLWDLAKNTYCNNFPDARFYQVRCETLNPATVKRQTGNIDILLASPECTSHTCAKGSSPRSEISRATAFQVVRYAKTFKPRWIIVENVVHMRSWRRFKTWLNTLQNLGYSTRIQVLNAADFGVPQTRRRLFVMADSEGVPPLVKIPNIRRQIPIQKLIETDNGFPYTPLYKQGRAKPTLARAHRAMKALGRSKPFLIVYYGSDGAGGWQRVDKPLRTVTTVDRFAFVRPSANGHEMRMLQVPELKCAMGFPEEHQFEHGTRRDKIKLLGNAVCPPVMKAVIEALIGNKA